MKGKRLLCVLLAVLLLTARPVCAEELEFPDDLPEAPAEETEPLPEPDPEPEVDPEPEPEPDLEPDPDPEPAPEVPEEFPTPEPEPEAPEIPEDPAEDPAEIPGEEELPSEAKAPEDGEEAPDLPGEEPLTVAEEPPVINVLLPDGGRVVVNPYGLEVSTEYGVSREQVVHAPQVLTNLSEVPVSVNVRAAGSFSPWSDAYLVTEPPLQDTPWKELFLYVEFQPALYQWNGWFSDLPNQVMVTPWGESKADVLTLEPWSEGWFRLSGAASGSPDQMWTAEDTVNVTLAFTFEPVIDSWQIY